MIKHLVFDIETVCDEHLIRQTQYPGQNFDEPWGAVKKYQDQLLESSGGKSSFIPHTYHLPVSVAVVAVDDKLEISHLVTLDRPQFRPQKIADLFWRMWRKSGFPQFVTFNGRGFDVPVMELCTFRYGLNVKEWFEMNGPSYVQPRNRFNKNSHFDLMEFFTNFGATRFTGGLNLAASLIGKPGKLDTKGSMVQELWEADEKIRIDDYCVCDSLDTYFVFLRTQVMMGVIDIRREQKLIELAKLVINKNQSQFEVLEQYLDEFRLWQAPLEEDTGFYNPEKFLKG